MNLVLLCQDDFLDARTVRLSGRRLRHVLEVHRAAPGDRLTVGLENGQIGQGLILALGSDRLELQIDLDSDPPPALPLRLVLALPRPKMLKRVLQSAVSLGVKQLHLINSYRVEKSFWGSPLLTPAGLREPVVLGLEQARDTVLPEVTLHKLFKPFVEDQLPELARGTTPLVAHPGSPEPLPGAEAAPVTLAIGPEGGFIPYEIELLRQCGFRPVSFGPRILRVETAVPALLSRFMQIGAEDGL
jgi:16S rRNA (uracil1498-N3)-methyltransferase